MPSRQLIDAERQVRAMLAAIDAHGEEIARAVTTKLKSHLPRGTNHEGFLVYLSGLRAQVDNAHKAAARAETAHEQELADDALPRRQRDDAASALSSVLTDLRDTLAANFEDNVLRLFHLDAPVPVPPGALAEVAQRVYAALTSADVKLPKPRRRGLKLDRAEFAAEIHEHLPPLRKALADVAREEREASVTLKAKDEAFAALEEILRVGAPWLEQTASLAGMPGIAEPLRLSRRRGGKDAPSDDSSNPQPKPTPAPSN